MKKTILAVAITLGFSAVGFSQTEISSGEYAVVENKGVKENGSCHVAIVEKNTGMVKEIFIENNTVTIIPGELLIIKNNGTDHTAAFEKGWPCRYEGPRLN